MKKTTRLSLLLLLVASVTAAPEAFGAKKGSTLVASGTESKAAAVCDWYDISCSNGTTDECCGSSSSCGSYCAEVCGERCIEVE